MTKKATTIHTILSPLYPDTKPFLNYDTPFQLILAVVLSAQCTDDRVNLVTPHLFSKFGTIETLSAASLEQVRDLVKSVNYFNTKAKHLIQIAQILLTDFESKIPDTIEDLIKLPGVGRKSANVIIGHIHNKPAITVDTHVRRLSQRIGFTTHNDPTKIEKDLQKKWPKPLWFSLSTLLILHGRNRCRARKPDCKHCEISTYCNFLKPSN